MPNPIVSTLSLVDASGLLIITAIVACLIAAVAINLLLRRRYAEISRELWQNPDHHQPFKHPVLEAVTRDVRIALLRTRDINTQAIVEQRFQSELKGLLLGERFVRASSGLVIILGLVGTFYGLTLSIGRLVVLVSKDGAAMGAVSEIAPAITQGLTQALTGMSVAFSTSLFGIASAIVLTAIGIASNNTDQRTALMVQLETYIDHVMRTGAGASDAAGAGSDASDRLERMLSGFGKSVASLDGAVSRFDVSLQGFAANTRDFQEFNLHLKDNVQRMSLSFSDFSEALKARTAGLQSTDRT